jgi:hypothetical protein
MADSWSNLASSVAAFASQQSGIPGASEASQVILALCGIENEQATMLRRIQSDVSLLRMGPFHSARVHLETADRKGSAHPDYEFHLREAVSLFIQALGQSASAEERSVVAFNLGLVEAVRGDAREARSRLEESYGYCVTASQELVAKANNLAVLRSRRIDTILVATHLVGPFVIMRSLRKLKKANEAAAALEGYVPFVNTVSRTGNAIQRPVKQSELKLREVPGTSTEYRRYELEWTPIQ